MTAPMMTVAEPAEQGSGGDVLRQRVQFVTPRLMDINVQQSLRRRSSHKKNSGAALGPTP
jgi:hypothetical protein